MLYLGIFATSVDFGLNVGIDFVSDFGGIVILDRMGLVVGFRVLVK